MIDFFFDFFFTPLEPFLLLFRFYIISVSQRLVLGVVFHLLLECSNTTKSAVRQRPLWMNVGTAGPGAALTIGLEILTPKYKLLDTNT